MIKLKFTAETFDGFKTDSIYSGTIVMKKDVNYRTVPHFCTYNDGSWSVLPLDWFAPID